VVIVPSLSAKQKKPNRKVGLFVSNENPNNFVILHQTQNDETIDFYCETLLPFDVCLHHFCL
jgi:hypothetical protein